MTEANKINVVIKAENEFSKAVGGPGSGTMATSAASPFGASLSGALSTPGGNSGSLTLSASSGAGLSTPGADGLPGGFMVASYAQRLEEERAFQVERLGIIKSATLEEFTTMGQHSDEQLLKERENNEIRKGNTKALVGASLSLMSTLMSGSKKNNKAMFEAHKAYSIGKAMVNAHTAASEAFKENSGNPAFGGLMAAVALAKGMMIVRSIASQRITRSVGSGGGAMAGGGSSVRANRSSVPYAGGRGEVKKGMQNIVVNIHNPLSDENWAKVVEDNIIPALENAGQRNVLLDVNV